MKLGKRELRILRSVREFSGRYTKCWSPKTCDKLILLGLVRENGSYDGYATVEITQEGTNALQAESIPVVQKSPRDVT